MKTVAILIVLVVSLARTSGKPYFYIYEWPNQFDDLWPKPGATLHNKSGYSHEFYENRGAGKLLNSDLGLFQTWQFSLYKNVMARLRVSEHRTKDPKKAVAFIIPFDLGVHSYIDHVDGHPRLASPLGWAAGYFLINASRDKKLWWHNNGHDHFVLFSITAYQMVGIGVKVFFMQICQNCTTITIETSPTKTAIKGRTRKHWYAAPYPSSFHWHENIKQIPWEYSAAHHRKLLALFIGSVKTSQPNSNNLRKLLYTQCLEEPTICQWHKTAHACNGVVNAAEKLLLLREAVYCPAPTGDSITRKSIFDSLAAGCIPVLFSRASLTQYSWHLTEKDVDEVSVYIPMKSINDEGTNFLKILKSIPPEVVVAKQKAIALLAPSLQYSVVPEYAGNGSDGTVWHPPFRDAADVIIEKILDRNTVKPLQGFTDSELLSQVELQNEIMDTHEDYAALRAVSKDDRLKGNGADGGGGGVGTFGSALGGGRREKVQIAKGLSGISKIVTSETIQYPNMGALVHAKDFMPMSIFRNTEVVEYKDGRYTFITGSASEKEGYPLIRPIDP